MISMTLSESDNSNLFKKSSLIDKSIHIMHHTKPNEEAVKYWSDMLRLPLAIFKCFKAKPGRNPFGVCHVYISNVLLRKVIDMIHEEIFLKGIN
jgi:hypothetical protein